ncbi:MAG: DUF2723 domain-containing protein, partial [Verrucomicrobiae bacterium]|nr:DUF2723 domain-containing protein [Verrucomicrobiae bacterium]
MTESNSRGNPPRREGALPGFLTLNLNTQPWIVFWVTFLVALAVYVFTLAPGVVLRDSGELVTAAYHLGVPHPPGYPLHTILGKVFTWFPIGNVAWRVNLSNAVCGALAVGVFSFVSCLSGRLILSKYLAELEGARREIMNRAIGFCSITAGLVLAFSHVMWSQSVVTEKYALNSLLFTLILLFLFLWVQNPPRLLWMVAAVYFFGLGFSAHQTTLFFYPGIVAAVFLTSTLFIPNLARVGKLLSQSPAILRDVNALIQQSFLSVVAIPSFKFRALFLVLCLTVTSLLSLASIALGDSVGVAFIRWILVNGAVVFCLCLGNNFFRAFLIFSLVFVNTAFGAFAYLSHDLQVVDICLRFLLFTHLLLVCLVAFIRPLKWYSFLFLLYTSVSILSLSLGAFALRAPDLNAVPPQQLAQVMDSVIDAKSTYLILDLIFSSVFCLLFFFSGSRELRSIPAMFLAGWAGLIMYGYINLASSTNPPMNWGYGSTRGGFFHAINRGQYENNLANSIKGLIGPITSVQSLAGPPPAALPLDQKIVATVKSASEYWKKVQMYFEDLQYNVTIYLLIVSLVPLFYILRLNKNSVIWLCFLSIAFLFLSAMLIYMIGGDTDRQSRWINRVFYLPSHIVFVFFIGYGLMFAYLFLIHSGWNLAGPSTLMLLCLLPVFSKIPPQNLANWELAEQRHHDFGWQYGYDMLIDCDRDSFIFGGTDPGRFVPTYMIFCESTQNPRWKMDRIAHPGRPREFDRRDMYIVTQNALADETYMNYIRDHYGYSRPAQYNWFEKLLKRDVTYPKNPMWIPERIDGENAFRQYVDFARTNPGGAPGVRVTPDGRVSIAGIEGVFAINGILAEMIFLKNRDKMQFYVEESFPLLWMYPYLEPFGLIMRLNRDPLPAIPMEKVHKDMEYWNAYTARLVSNPAYRRDEDAQKAFSKLRTSIGGLYEWRALHGTPKPQTELIPYAEKAYQQAIDLCPFSTESVFRYVGMLNKLERFNESLELLANLKKLDPHNTKIDENMAIVQNQANLLGQQRNLLAALDQNPGDLNAQMQLFATYLQRGKLAEADARAAHIMAQKDMTNLVFTQMAQMYANAGRMDRTLEVLQKLVQKQPSFGQAWYDIAVIQSMQLQGEKAVDALEQCLRYGGA